MGGIFNGLLSWLQDRGGPGGGGGGGGSGERGSSPDTPHPKKRASCNAIPIGTRIPLGSKMDGYIYGQFSLGLVAGVGGVASYVNGVQVSNGVVVATFSGFNFHAGLGFEGQAAASVNYSSTMPIVTSGVQFSAEGGAGPIGGSAAFTRPSENQPGSSSLSGGVGLGVGLGGSVGVDASGGMCIAR
jgi:hypothetical protein